MKNKLLGFMIVLALLGATWSSALAQTYLFRVETYTVDLAFDTQGLATIDYNFVFANAPSAGPIEFVDVGLPNSSYHLSDIVAEVNGTPVSSIEPSPYVSPGVALDLRPNDIKPNESGKVHVRIRNIPGMLYPGTQEEAEPYVSFRFSPTYFDSQSVQGNTNMTVTIFLPPGMTPDQPTYYRPEKWPGEADPEAGIDTEGRVYYRWTSDKANASREYIFGGALPASLVPAGAVVQPPPQQQQASRPGNQITFDSGTVCCIGLGLLFFAIFALAIYTGIVSERKRKLKYLPPKISVEGHGIKRGLTSVEAAVLLEQPIDKVMTMILFSVIKKNAARVVSRDPLKVEVESPPPEGLQPYELDFLKAMEESNPKEQRRKLQDVVVNLIRGVEGKMKGFSHKETVAYYKDIMQRAWEQVQAADAPEMKMEKFDEFMGWTMLDKDFDQRTRDTFGTGPVFIPGWWGRFDPTYSSGPAGPVSSPGKVASPIPSSSGQRTINLPNLPGSDFAASMINGVQSFSAGVIGNLASFTGAITNRTNPLPPTATQRSTWRSGGGGGGGGGGRSCACACACAGCACACAGGGR